MIVGNSSNATGSGESKQAGREWQRQADQDAGRLESGDTHVSHWYLEATGMTPSFTASGCISGRPTKNTLPDPGLQSDFTKGGYSSLALFLTVPQPPNLAPEQSLWDLSEWLQSTLFN